MKKIVKNAIFIVILIVIAMSIFNISYAMLSTGNFSKLSTVKNTTVFTKDNDVKYSNLQSYKIENKDYNNSAYYQTIKVKRNTPYKISCMIKTSNVEINNNTKNSGAKISILNSEEESTAITGTNEWQKITLMFNSKNEENLQIAFMLGGNSNEGSAKGIVWFADFKIEEGTANSNNNWNVACFVFKNTDVNINKKQYKYEMSKDDINQINDCMKRFKSTCEEFSNNNITISYKIIEIENPIKSMHRTTSRISVATNIAIIAGMFVINISILFINVVVIWLISIISCDTLPTASHLNAKNVMHRNAFSLIFLKSPTIRTI